MSYFWIPDDCWHFFIDTWLYRGTLLLRFSIHCYLCESYTCLLVCLVFELVFIFCLLLFCSGIGYIAFIHQGHCINFWVWTYAYLKYMCGKGVKYNGSNIAPFGNIVTISTLLSLYRWSTNDWDDVYAHE